ncbi:MAG TPA: phage tail tube protein [Paracoccaceae bacterium]|nr:phage tail tube protein [Paracoccaceae bacterium]
MARAYGSRAQLALAFETTYGTAPASGYTFLPFAGTTLSSEQPLIENELLGYGRDPLAPIRDAVTVDGDITIGVDAIGIGFWLKALFGGPATTTGSGPYTHTFHSGGTTLPSLAIETQMPEVPRFDMVAGARANTLRIEATRRGQLQATVGLIAQGLTGAGSSAAGTPAAIALQRFGHFNCAITRDSVALGNTVSAELTYSNGLEAVETIRADGLIDGVDPTIAGLRGRLVTRFADTTLLAQATSGGTCELQFAWTIAGGPSLTWTIHRVHLPVPRRTIPGPQGIQAEFDWQASLAASPARMCTVVLVNDQAAY